MPLFLDCPPEVICSILDHLAPDSQSLDALCLAGNHNLLALTRPYTWIEVNLVLGAEREAGWRTGERLQAFIADPAKVGAVRSLNISLAGPYTTLRTLQIVIHNLEAFVNVTHVSFCCIRSRNVVGWPTPGHFVKDAVLFLPSLISITVIGCNAEIPSELVDIEEVRKEAELPPPKLFHVSTRFCHENLAQLWRHCPNLRVLEIEGGDAGGFCHATTATEEIKQTGESSTTEEIEIAQSWPGSDQFYVYGFKGSDIGIQSLFSRNDNDDDEIIDIIDIVETVKLKSEDAPTDDSGLDVYELTNFFEMNPDAPPKCLKELDVSLPFDADDYYKILDGMRGPIIERLAVVLSHKDHWVGTEFDELVLDLKNSEQNSGTLPYFAAFESLAEFCLPCDGVSAASMVMLAELLSHAPALQHLWFDTADEPDLLSAAARKYGECILTLKSVSWKNQATFEVKRSDGLASVEVVRKTYAAPMWQEWRGVGKWWEM
ncbi:hypothetical protein FB451DRAFT_1553027 [Mycena latifolia]|nr:hypothetical protein FB451DRAFT_1553027 [Mycena latifolia]